MPKPNTEVDPTIPEIIDNGNMMEEPQLSGDPTPTEDPAPAASAKSDLQVNANPPASDVPEGTEPAPEFAPNYKYKVRDEEHEIEEWARPLITNEEMQKKFQDLYTRGHGLELAKTERDDFKSKYTNLENSLQIVNGYVQSHRNNPGDATVGHESARQFIDSLGLPKQMFLQYAVEELKYSQLPPEQRQAIDQQRQQQYDYQQTQSQNQQLADQNLQMQINHRNQMLDYTLADPSINPVVADYEARVGKPGAFRELVVQRGIYHDQINKQDVTPQVAVQEVMQMLGLSAQQQGQPGTANPTQTVQPGTVPVQQQQKPVIPNIQGQPTASPTKAVVNNLDDIRRLAKEAAAQG